MRRSGPAPVPGVVVTGDGMDDVGCGSLYKMPNK
jgi:hypothetical protein